MRSDRRRLSQQHGEIIVADSNDRVSGGVVYIGPGKPKAASFDPMYLRMGFGLHDAAPPIHGVPSA